MAVTKTIGGERLFQFYKVRLKQLVSFSPFDAVGYFNSTKFD